jgi:hypothetical protein
MWPAEDLARLAKNFVYLAGFFHENMHVCVKKLWFWPSRFKKNLFGPPCDFRCAPLKCNNILNQINTLSGCFYVTIFFGNGTVEM